MLPEVPEIVTWAEPTAAFAEAVNVTVLVVVAGLGLNEAVTPLGNPEAERVAVGLQIFVDIPEGAIVGRIDLHRGVISPTIGGFTTL